MMIEKLTVTLRAFVLAVKRDEDNTRRKGKKYLPRSRATFSTNQISLRRRIVVCATDLPFIVPRVEFHDYLQGLMRAGLGKRTLFGSDYSPIRTAIEAIAPYEPAD